MEGLGAIALGYTEGQRQGEGDIASAEAAQSKAAMAGEAHASQMDERQQKLADMRQKAVENGFSQSIKYALAGDFAKAEEFYNSQGEGRIKKGSMKMIKGKNGEEYIESVDADSGERKVMKKKMAMMLAGIHPRDIAGGQDPAIIKEAKYILGNLKNDDGSPMSPNQAYKMAKSGKHSREMLVSKVMGQISAADAKNFTERTPEEMQTEVMRRMAMIDKLAGINKKKDEFKGDASEGAIAAPNTGKIDRSGTGGYSELWK